MSNDFGGIEAMMRIVRNGTADRHATYGKEQLAAVSSEQTRQAAMLLRRCPLYARTPLHAFDHLAGRLGLGRILVKDETSRLGLSSFKALGGAYAVMRRSRESLVRGGIALNREPQTFATATDGNHGISVAAGAWLTGDHSVCLLPQHVEQAYEDAMRLLGAVVIRLDSHYDNAVAQVDRTARQNGWTVVSDTTEKAFDPVARDVLAGYGVMVEEAMAQLLDLGHLEGPRALTHVFVQGGVGGLAAAFAGGLWQRLGPRRPTFVIVEPRNADCLFESARRSQLSGASGDLSTSMGMLSCGRPSRMAWTILQSAGDVFVTIEDSVAIKGVTAFASESVTRGRFTTPSGAAGLSGLIEVATSSEARAAAGLDERSVILTICSEQRPDRAALESLMSRRQIMPA